MQGFFLIVFLEKGGMIWKESAITGMETEGRKALCFRDNRCEMFCQYFCVGLHQHDTNPYKVHFTVTGKYAAEWVILVKVSCDLQAFLFDMGKYFCI